MRGTDQAPSLWLKLVRFVPIGRHVLHSMHRNPQQHSFWHKQLAPAKPHVLLQVPACCPRTHHRKQPHAFLHVTPFLVTAAAADAAAAAAAAATAAAAAAAAAATAAATAAAANDDDDTCSEAG